MRLLLFALFLSLLPFSLVAQTPTPSIPDLPNRTLSYRTKTVWGLIQALVKPQDGSFILEVRSESPMTGWTLKNESGDQTLGKGGLAAVGHFSTQVPKPFRGNFKLTVFLSSDQESVPVALQIGSKATVTGEIVPVLSEEEYEESPDHPYHAMVHNLYEQALADLTKGDKFKAREHLEKAANLDPLQPQVQDLLKKIDNPSPKTSDPIDAIQTYSKPQKEMTSEKETAKKQRKVHSESTLKSRSQTKAHKQPAAINEREAQSKADQTYNLGLESYRKNDYAAAKKFWEETLQILPTHGQARRNLDRLQEDHPELK